MNSPELVIGIDVGTAGVRGAAVGSQGEVFALVRQAMVLPGQLEGRPSQDPRVWWEAVRTCLQELIVALRGNGMDAAAVGGIAVDGTSGTMLLCDTALKPLTSGLMYDSSGFVAELAVIKRHAPAGHMVRGHSSGLARLLYLLGLPAASGARHALHQADWISGRLMGKGGQADANNCLKTGYDPVARAWPDWLLACGVPAGILPEVSEPGVQIGVVDEKLAGELGLSPACRVHLGTTDSNAAFLAAGPTSVGDAVTSLGTTLAVKVLSRTPVSDLASGVYSHRIGGAWLVGGASNSGGAVVAKHFTPAEITALTAQLDPDALTGLEYYPLLQPGERFPTNDPDYPPVLEPRPATKREFFQAILEGIALVENRAYRRLEELGAPAPRQVYTCGGGAANVAWNSIRAKILDRPVRQAVSLEAAVGVARLARGPLALLADVGASA